MIKPANPQSFFKRKCLDIPICSICFQECKEDLGSIECGHVFHTGCINDWIYKKKRCPNCRAMTRNPKVCELKYKLEGILNQKKWKTIPNSFKICSRTRTQIK